MRGYRKSGEVSIYITTRVRASEMEAERMTRFVAHHERKKAWASLSLSLGSGKREGRIDRPIVTVRPQEKQRPQPQPPGGTYSALGT
jgi:hypothetical protein